VAEGAGGGAEEGITEMVKICLSNPGYYYAGAICSSINSVLQNHPLGTDILTPEVLDELIVKIDLKSGANIGIDCKQYPRVTLHVDSAKYEQKKRFNEELFRIHSYHEFTHLIDRLNRHFGLGLSENPLPNEMGLWNIYIDGRLWRRGIKVKSFEDYEQVLFGTRLNMGYDCSQAINESNRVWDAENVTYHWISVLTKKITQLAVSSSKANIQSNRKSTGS